MSGIEDLVKDDPPGNDAPLIAAARARRSANEWRATALRLQSDLENATRRLEIMAALQDQASTQPYEIKSRKKSGNGEATAVALAPLFTICCSTARSGAW